MRPTPMTEKIMRLHREAMHKLATPANELALQSAVESLERERAELIEALREMLSASDAAEDYDVPPRILKARILLTKLGERE